MEFNTKIREGIMDYDRLKEGVTNFAQISGQICEEPKKSHQVEGEYFYEFKVEVERLSKVKDIIPVTISERAIVGQNLHVGDFVKATGEYRSYNKLQDERSRLILHLFAKDLSVLNAEQQQENLYVNEVKLVGYVCKEPTYRKTPFDREICDVLLAVNRPNFHKSDYVPCIMWGLNARFMASQSIGCKVELVGRIQSREYTKTLPNDEVEKKTAYEVSCQRIAIISNVANMQPQNQERNKDII